MPPRLRHVPLPDWAADCGVQGAILVPESAIERLEADWQAVDWWHAMAWYLGGHAERAHEARFGPIHGYSLRLRGWDRRMWDRAWVNRVALFLRRWAAREAGVAEDALFGPLPPANIVLTHDVDAVRKTAAIRLKQAVFGSVNVGRRIARGISPRAKLREIARFVFSRDDYWCFDQITAAEEAAGVRSHFNVYGGGGGWRRWPVAALIDPGYDVLEPRLADRLQALLAGGWNVGLHQSFAAWSEPEPMSAERTRLETAIGAPVIICRQHWLRFSWRRTWRAQVEAGLALDTTLGFNDRPSFRNGAALRHQPWEPETAQPLSLESLPMVLMDSHLYDYADLDPEARAGVITRWLTEIAEVRGEATVLWHQQTLSEDYGWRDGFQALLSELVRLRARGHVHV